MAYGSRGQESDSQEPWQVTGVVAGVEHSRLNHKHEVERPDQKALQSPSMTYFLKQGCVTKAFPK